MAEVLKVQALCSPLAEVEKPELFAVYVTGLKFENALERNDVKEITEFCDCMDGPPSRVWNVASPLHVTEENPSRSLLYGDEGIECVTTLMSSVVTSTRYDWQSIPQYGEFFVCRLNLISATSVAWNSSGSETVYGLWPTDHRNFFPEPSLRKGAKWNPQPEHMVKYQKVQLTQSDFLIFSPMCLNIMVCLNKSLSLGLCDPRRCIRYIGYTTPVYPRYKYSAEVQLYWALHGTEGSNPECKYNAGARLFRTQRGTKGYCRGALHKCKYSVVRSSRTQPGTVGYHLGTSPMMQCIAEGKKAIASSAGTLEYNKCKCSADMKKATTFPWLQYIAEGKKVPTFETLFCLMLMWVLILSTVLSVASSWLLAHCLALLSTEFSVASFWLLVHYLVHYGNQGNLTSFRNGLGRIARRTTNQGQKVSRCCWSFKSNTASSPKFLLDDAYLDCMSQVVPRISSREENTCWWCILCLLA